MLMNRSETKEEKKEENPLMKPSNECEITFERDSVDRDTPI